MTPRSAVNEDETCTLHGSAIASVDQTKPVPETYLDAAAPAGSLFYYITALKSGNKQGESGSSNQVATGSLNAGAGSASHNFGNVTVGTSVLFHVTYTNNGLGTITVVAPTKSGTNGSDFTISPVTPAAGSAVAVGASLTFDVTFTPSTLGARSANIEINAKDGLQTGAGVFNTHVMPISGNGVSATGLTVNSASGTYGGTVTNLQATLSSSGSVDGKAISFSLHGISVGTANTNTSGVATLPTASLTGISAGTYTTGVSSTFAGDSSLAPASATASLTVNPKSVTATVTATNKAYDGTTTATIATCLLTGVVGSDSVNCDTSTGSANFSDKNVGNGKTVTVTGLKLAGTAAGNYALSATTTATTTANITAKSLTVHFTTSDKTYDSTTNASIIGCTLDGVVGTEGVSCVSSTAIAQFANKNVANGKVVTASGFTLSGSAAASYSIGTVNASSANITPRDVAVTATGLNKLYDGNPAATVTLSTNKLTGDAVSANYTSASFANKNIGTGKTVSVSGITISGTDAGNYNLTNTTASTTANITSKGVVINFTAQTRPYSGNTTATISGCSVIAVTGDDVTCDRSLATATFADKNVGVSKTVTGNAFTLAGAGAANYSFTTNATTASITPRDLNVTATGGAKTYDASSLTTVTLNTDKVPGDDLTATYAVASFGDKGAGLDKLVSVSGISISGTDSGNYHLVNTTTTTTANISQRDLSVA